MEFKIITKNGRKHIVIDKAGYDLVNSFFLVEGASFDDLISDSIEEFIKTEETQRFSGNIHTLKISINNATITDKISLAQCKLPTKTFIKIFYEWLDREDN